MANDSFFEQMVDDATEEVAKKGWRDANQNAVTLAAFGMLSKLISNRMHKVTRPFWWAAGAIGTWVLWSIVSSLMGL